MLVFDVRPLKHGDAHPRDSTRLGERYKRAIGFVEEVAEEYEIEGPIREGQFLGLPRHEHRARDKAPRDRDHLGAAVNARDTEGVPGEGLGENAGTRPHVEHRLDRESLETERDDALHLEKRHALRRAKHPGLPVEPLVAHRAYFSSEGTHGAEIKRVYCSQRFSG